MMNSEKRDESKTCPADLTPAGRWGAKYPGIKMLVQDMVDVGLAGGAVKPVRAIFKGLLEVLGLAGFTPEGCGQLAKLMYELAKWTKADFGSLAKLTEAIDAAGLAKVEHSRALLAAVNTLLDLTHCAAGACWELAELFAKLRDRPAETLAALEKEVGFWPDEAVTACLRVCRRGPDRPRPARQRTSVGVQCSPFAKHLFGELSTWGLASWRLAMSGMVYLAEHPELRADAGLRLRDMESSWTAEQGTAWAKRFALSTKSAEQLRAEQGELEELERQYREAPCEPGRGSDGGDKAGGDRGGSGGQGAV